MSFPIVPHETPELPRTSERLGEWAALAAIFRLFSNAVGVAVLDHGVPRVGVTPQSHEAMSIRIEAFLVRMRAMAS